MVIESDKNYHKKQKICSKNLITNYKKLGFRRGNNKGNDFTNFSSLIEPFRVIYYGEILIPAVEREQDNFYGMIEILKVYRPKKDSKYNGLKQDLIINAQNFYDGRDMITNAFKNKLFPFYSGKYYEEFKEESSESEGEDKIPDISTLEQITELGKFYGRDLIYTYFLENYLTKILKKLKHYKKCPEKCITP